MCVPDVIDGVSRVPWAWGVNPSFPVGFINVCTQVLKAFVSGEPLLVDRFLAANVDAVDSVSRAVAEIKHRRSGTHAGRLGAT